MRHEVRHPLFSRFQLSMVKLDSEMVHTTQMMLLRSRSFVLTKEIDTISVLVYTTPLDTRAGI